MELDVLKRISIIVPSLDPDEKLKNTVASLLEVGFTDIICVNDGSREECLPFFPEANENITRLNHEVNLGKGEALKTAFAYICENRPDSLGAITVDGDGQHAATDVLRCAERMIEAENKIILGCRDFSGSDVPTRSRFGNHTTSTVFRIFCGLKISDTQTGLRAFPAIYYKDMLEVAGSRFEYETNMLLEMKARKIPFEEVKIETVYIEENRTSHFRMIRDSYRIYSLIFKFTFGQIFKFFLSSLAAAVVDSALLYLFSSLFEFSFSASAAFWITFASCILARCISSLVNYFINRAMVFPKGTPFRSSFFRYYALAAPVALVYATFTALSTQINVPSILPIENESFLITLVGFLVNCIIFCFNYFIQKKWVFKKNK